MKHRVLRLARVVIAACVFLALTAFFLDFNDKISPNVVWLAKFQFIPALLAGSFFIFMALVLATLAFGRVYCSIICPLGIFQDVISWVGRIARSVAAWDQRFTQTLEIWGIRFSKRVKEDERAQDAEEKKPVKKAPPKKIATGRNYKFRPNHWILRVVCLVLAILSTFLGGCYFGLIEPYGIFGRVIVNVFKPVYVFVNNILYWISSTFFNSYSFYYVDLRPESIGALTVGVLSFVVLCLFAGAFGRLYCNTICPVGTILGFLSKHAFFKTRINAEKCVGCGLCAKACKSSCIDVKRKTVDSTRCVVCFDCFSACRKNAISYGKGLPKIAPNDPAAQNSGAKLDEATKREKERAQREAKGFDRSKRNFIALTALTATAVATRATLGETQEKTSASEAASSPETSTSKELAKAKPDDYGLTPYTREHTLTPPGSKSYRRFHAKCVGCHLCVAKCPQRILKPSGLENGLGGFMQPRVDFTHGFCNYDCTVCGDVCPTGAILPLAQEEKHLVQMGRVVFIKENCIVYAQETSCGACSEHCPTQALRMVPYGDTGLTIPETNTDICVGCGACEYICPARPFRAVYIEGNTEHLQAKPIEKAETQEVENVDFGF